jgi:hypothetical protein
MTDCSPQGITIEGITYPSLSAAARALGIDASHVSKAKRMGRVHKIGKGSGRNNVKPTVVAGVRYGSLTEASDAIGATPAELRGYFNVKQILEEMGAASGGGA